MSEKSSSAESSDDLLAGLLSEMHQLVEARRPDMTPADLENAMAWIRSVAAACRDATEYANRMRFSDAQAREFMAGILRALLDCTRRAVSEATRPQRVH